MKKTKKLIRTLCALMTVVILGTSCLGFSSCSTKINATELSKGVTPSTGGESPEDSLTQEEFSALMNGFSFDLMRGVTKKDGENILVSPLSAILALSLISNGFAGDTLAEVEEYFGTDIERLCKYLGAYADLISKNSEVKLANSIWLRDEENRLHVNDAFLQDNAKYFNAQIYSAPFDGKTLEDINNWVSHYTDGMIDKILDEPIPYDTVMYLINALCFDAKWKEKYEKSDIFESVFRNYGGSGTQVDFLGSTESTFLQGENFIGTAKPYENGKFSLVTLLPDEKTDIHDFISSLNGNVWRSAWESRQSRSVTLYMPEFSYDSDMMLNDLLSSLGMGKMFSPSADLSRLGYSEAGNLYVSYIRQKTFIDVSRNGTKASAATIAAVNDEQCAMISELIIRLDRPFVYMIVDSATGIPVFAGSVINLE